MRKFKFKLNTPLKVKRMMEEIKKQRVAEAILLKNKEEYHLEKLKELNIKARDVMKQSLSDSIKSEDLFWFESFTNDLKSLVDSQKIAVKNAQEAYNCVMQSFIESKREKQILEKLREKKLELYLKDFNREEQKSSDESAITNFNRREGG